LVLEANQLIRHIRPEESAVFIVHVREQPLVSLHTIDLASGCPGSVGTVSFAARQVQVLSEGEFCVLLAELRQAHQAGTPLRDPGLLKVLLQAKETDPSVGSPASRGAVLGRPEWNNSVKVEPPPSPARPVRSCCEAAKASALSLVADLERHVEELAEERAQDRQVIAELSAQAAHLEYELRSLGPRSSDECISQIVQQAVPEGADILTEEDREEIQGMVSTLVARMEALEASSRLQRQRDQDKINAQQEELASLRDQLDGCPETTGGMHVAVLERQLAESQREKEMLIRQVAALEGSASARDRMDALEAALVSPVRKAASVVQ